MEPEKGRRGRTCWRRADNEWSVTAEPVAKLHAAEPTCICTDYEAGWCSVSCRVPGHGLVSPIGAWEVDSAVYQAYLADKYGVMKRPGK